MTVFIKTIAWITISICFYSCSSAPSRNNESVSLWIQVEGEEDNTVVFISGNGNDSSVWSNIVPDVRKMGVRTVTYDRAGLGQSKLRPGEYVIDNEATSLQLALDEKGIDGNIILVAHSYGGLIATLIAHENSRVKGIVLVDALLPDDLSEEVVAGTLAKYRPQYKQVQEQAPDLAKAVIPVVEAYPATAKRMKKMDIAQNIPVIDIVAEESWTTVPEQLSYIRRVHLRFAALASHRKIVNATGSSHNVMRDKPGLITQAISDILMIL
jgi:pimeloyl-ACP methyl ester carboxylesterase